MGNVLVNFFFDGCPYFPCVEVIVVDETDFSESWRAEAFMEFQSVLLYTGMGASGVSLSVHEAACP